MCLPAQLRVEPDEHCQDSAEMAHAGDMEGCAEAEGRKSLSRTVTHSPQRLAEQSCDLEPKWIRI
eukprot:11663320-Heterocapsa_arctica.AAC.1